MSAKATVLNAANIRDIGLYADLNSVDGPKLCYCGGDIRNCNICYAGQPELQRFRLQKLQFDEASEIEGHWEELRSDQGLGNYSEYQCPDFVHLTDCFRQSMDSARTEAEYRSGPSLFENAFFLLFAPF